MHFSSAEIAPYLRHLRPALLANLFEIMLLINSAAIKTTLGVVEAIYAFMCKCSLNIWWRVQRLSKICVMHAPVNINMETEKNIWTQMCRFNRRALFIVTALLVNGVLPISLGFCRKVTSLNEAIFNEINPLRKDQFI